MKLKSLIIAVLSLLAGAAHAELTTGYYCIKSHNSLLLTENTSSHSLVCSDAVTPTNYSQVWYIDASKGTLQNALTQRYVQGQTGLSYAYSTVETEQYFTITDTDGTVTFTWDPAIYNAGMHCDASNNVVEWMTSEDKSKWTVEAVTVDQSALTAQRAATTVAATDLLTTFFTDATCSELRTTWSDYSDADLRSAMRDLPASVQELGLKVKNDAWSTYTDWDKTEKTFRVASYNAYSSHTRWPGIVGYGHAFGRLTNPTGIYVDAGDVIQVYVGTIPSGQTVKLEVAGYGQASGTQYALTEGMNALLMASAGNCFVNYEVDNTTSGVAPYTAISSYPAVTVHIEGGTVQGYFDLTRGDTDADFAAMKAYLMTKPTVCLKSSTHVFNLYRDLLISALGTEGKVEAMLGVWTSVAQMEDRLTAREDFDAYCNNIYSVTGRSGTGNPNATTYGTNYYEAAYSGIFNADALMQNVGGLWTIAHEQGHNRQLLIKMIGTTEVSNNVFSNAALDWQGRYTSRVMSLQNTFALFQQGMSWPERLNNKEGDYHLWETLHLYVQLYQYFHQAGINTSFYPNLVRALRTSPMTYKSGVAVPASEDYLKFYETCCEVAQLDLTEFFEVYGFFTLPAAQEAMTVGSVNMGQYYQVIDDYATFYLYVTQEMIDDAKGRVAAKGYQKCNLIFVEDRVTAPLATYVGHTDGELRQLSMQDNVTAFGQVGETGQYNTFGATCSAYTYALIGTTVKMSGTGAVGFKVYDAAGTLRGVYNTYTFTLPDAIGEGYSIKAAAGDGSDVLATLDDAVATEESDVTDDDVATATVTVGSQVTTESDIVSGKAYLVYYPGSGDVPHSGYLTDTGSAYSAQDNTVPTLRDIYVFTSIGASKWYVRNYVTGNYWGIPPTTNTTNYVGSSTPGEWSLNFDNGTMYPKSNDTNGTSHSWNRSSGKIHPWSSGTGDANRMQLFEIALPTDFDNKDIAVASEPAATLATDQWYVMFDRGTSPHSHGYLYENGSNKLMNTATAPSGSATANAKYLVRIIGRNNEYYLQTGLGNYFGTIEQSTNVATTATPSSPVTLKKIADTDGHYYIKSAATGIILDANSLENGDATVVGWGTTVPTSTGGNNDWAFYPVEFVTSSDSRYVADQTPLSAAPSASDGWYVLAVASGDYAGSFVSAPEGGIEYQTNRNYPLTFASGINPTINEPLYYTRIIKTSGGYAWQLPNGRYLATSGSYFPMATTAAADIGITYTSSGMQFTQGNFKAVVYLLSGKYFVGETRNTGGYFTVYPIDLDKAGLTPWQVVIPSAGDDTRLTCTRDDVSGLTAVYNGGYFFLPADVTPESTDFTLDGMMSCAIDADAHTITVEYDPTIALLATNVSVNQGWQTVGRGGEVQLLRINVEPMRAATEVTLAVALKDGSESSINTLTLYEASSSSPEILSTGTGAPTKTTIATATVTGSTATLAIGNLSADTHYYWLGASVADDAALGTVIDAAVTGITYTCGGKETTLDLSATGDPEARGAMVFAVQTYPFLPRDNDSRVYRIPAMVVADDGSIVAAVDKRYDSHTDIGNGHVIDIVVRRSTDGGLTWGDPVVIAKGQGTADAARCGYGYGDPSLVKGKDGKLYCLFAAGNTGYFYGLRRICISTSTDNGITWSSSETTPPIDLYETGAIKDAAPGEGNVGGYGLYDYFVTSGRGLYTSDGILMYLIPAQPLTADNYESLAFGTYWNATSHDYVFYSTDDGATWHFSPKPMVNGGDEAKIIQMNDGSLLGSIRKASARRFNTGTYTRNADGTLAFTFGTQWDNAQLSQTSQNNQDILYYQRCTETGKTDLIFHSITTGNHANFKLFYSTDEGLSWTEFLNVQTKATRYVTMDRSAAGDLYLLFEDQSLNEAGGYNDYNHYPINFICIPRAQLETLIPTMNDDYVPVTSNEVKVVYGTTAHTAYGTISGDTWTSGASSGVAGLTMTKSDGDFNQFSNWNSHFNLAYKPAAANVASTLTLTAPEGYRITGYSLLAAKAYSASHTYTLTADNGTTITPAFASSATGYTALTVTGLNTTSTAISVTTTNASYYLAIADFVVALAPIDTYTRSVTSGRWGTVCVAGAVAPTDIEGAAIYRIAGKKLGTDGQPAYLQLDAVTAMEAGVPYLFQATSSELRLTFTPSVLQGGTDNGLIGTFTGQTVAEGKYLLHDNTIVLCGTGCTVGANRAYIDMDQVPTTTSSGVKSLAVSLNPLTGIDGLDAARPTAATGAIYNVGGQRLARPQRGVNIVGGRKVVVK